MRHESKNLDNERLGAWVRRRELTHRAEADIAKAIGAAGAQAPPHPNQHVKPDPGDAAGIPLQIVMAGQPVVSFQRGYARPDRISDCPLCGRHCHCAA